METTGLLVIYFDILQMTKVWHFVTWEGNQRFFLWMQPQEFLTAESRGDQQLATRPCHINPGRKGPRCKMDRRQIYYQSRSEHWRRLFSHYTYCGRCLLNLAYKMYFSSFLNKLSILCKQPSPWRLWPWDLQNMLSSLSLRLKPIQRPI
jgi:hypothetical protein